MFISSTALHLVQGVEGGQAGVGEEGAVGRGEVCQVGAVLGQGGHQGVTADTWQQ